LLETLADNIGMALEGDEGGLMNKLAIAVNGDGAEREQRPRTADPTRKKAPAGQSHIREARQKPLAADLPKTGPMAAMLARMFGKKE
jgi:PTH1 family peptidyl-tRNA hydrolase